MAVPGVLNKVDAVLYDTYTLVKASDSNKTISMFQTQVGAGGKTIRDTNMRAGGQMPKPEKFEVRSLRYILKTIVAADAKILAENVVVEFSVNNKSVAEWLGSLLPGGAGVTATSVLNGIADLRAVYTFENPIELDTQTPFAVNLLVGDVSGLTVDTAVVVVMDGSHFKAVS